MLSEKINGITVFLRINDAMRKEKARDSCNWSVSD